MRRPCVCLVGCLAMLGLVASEDPYASSNKSPDKEEDDSQIYVYPTGFKGGRYYYGGIYRGTCHNDGLYYRDDSTFVICSNGNAYVQPCAPGTRSSGQHRYSPGYYYGYSDFCDINLVDQGYGPAHYAPYGVPTYNEAAPSYGSKDTPQYDTKQPTVYGESAGTTYHEAAEYGGYNQYRGTDGYGSYHSAKDPYDKKKDVYAGQDSYSKDPYAKDPYAKDPYAKDPYAKDSYTKDSYGKDVYGKGPSYSPYDARDLYDKKETAYDPSAKY